MFGGPNAFVCAFFAHFGPPARRPLKCQTHVQHVCNTCATHARTTVRTRTTWASRRRRLRGPICLPRGERVRPKSVTSSACRHQVDREQVGPEFASGGYYQMPRANATPWTFVFVFLIFRGCEEESRKTVGEEQRPRLTLRYCARALEVQRGHHMRVCACPCGFVGRLLASCALLEQSVSFLTCRTLICGKSHGRFVSERWQTEARRSRRGLGATSDLEPRNVCYGHARIASWPPGGVSNEIRFPEHTPAYGTSPRMLRAKTRGRQRVRTYAMC